MNSLRKKQKGLATLISAAAILVLISLIVIASVNTGVMETRINANEYRSAQAFMAAQAGIDYALASLSSYDLSHPVAPLTTVNGSTMRINKTALQHSDGGSTVTTGYYTVTINKSDPLNLVLTSDGLSADEESKAKIVQKISFANPLRDDAYQYIVAPIIATGSINVDANKVNQGSFAAKTFSAGAISGNNIPSNKLTKLDQHLFELDNAAKNSWSKVFASDKTQIKHFANRTDCSTACNNPASMTGAMSYSRVHFTQGGSLTLNNVTLGSNNNPVILIVDLSAGGNLTLSGNTTINGFLYVIGNWNNGGNAATINGTAIIDGNLSNGTSLKFRHNNSVNSNIVNTGIYTRVPGSWSDVN